ncbi:MAG: EamA family transporter [Gammaproteobacteria bacterium]|nr:EamA family transporter [Gammaproteobacteria bacterium]
MPEIWIPITIAAAFFQNIRSALQKHLQDRLSVAGAAYARFVYALPPAAAYLWALSASGDAPAANARFLIHCLLGGVCQIGFTLLLLWLFSFRSFAVGTAFSKLEVVMVALLGALLLGDALNAVAVFAILTSAFGAVVLSAARAQLRAAGLLASLAQKPTLIGLACAACLGASTVFFRGAALSLEHESAAMAAGYTLLVALLMQTALMGACIALTERGELTRVRRNWRRGCAVGAAGALASICWFTAFTMHTAAHVRALGQIELLFTFLATTLVFREKITRAELAGIALVAGGILLLLLGG